MYNLYMCGKATANTIYEKITSIGVNVVKDSKTKDHENVAAYIGHEVALRVWGVLVDLSGLLCLLVPYT